MDEPQEQANDALYRGLPPEGDPWRDNELVRRLRLREAAKRSVSENLAEGIALSEFALRNRGAAQRQ
ncbi:hypothetical protein BH24ACT23_BH24ACT23_09760 [soil metagenome]